MSQMCPLFIDWRLIQHRALTSPEVNLAEYSMQLSPQIRSRSRVDVASRTSTGDPLEIVLLGGFHKGIDSTGCSFREAWSRMGSIVFQPAIATHQVNGAQDPSREFSPSSPDEVPGKVNVSNEADVSSSDIRRFLFQVVPLSNSLNLAITISTLPSILACSSGFILRIT